MKQNKLAARSVLNCICTIRHSFLQCVSVNDFLTAHRHTGNVTKMSKDKKSENSVVSIAYSTFCPWSRINWATLCCVLSH